MTDWHKENGYIRMHAIIAAYEMAQFLYKRHYKDDAASWRLVEIGSELNEFQFLKIRSTFEII